MGKLQLVIFVVITAVVSSFLYNILKDGELSEYVREETLFWGRKELLLKEDQKVYPFKIHVEDKVVTDLKAKLSEELNSQRFTEPLEGIGFQYGFNSNYLQKVLKYWQTKYDWRGREALLNKYPHFKTKIEGLDIHFQHVKSSTGSKYKTTKPLLLVHGWPGSFVEFQKIIPLLTDPKDSDVNFEVIIPSLPGYGFSEGPVRPGLGPIGTARVFAKLMNRLGFEKYYIHGGDWGAVVVAQMSTLFPNNVIAMHSTMCNSMHPRSNIRLALSHILPFLFMTAEESERFIPLSNSLTFLIRETGYMHIQATKPDTVGTALSLSPSGLAAYILEKFSTWTNLAGLEAEDGLLTKQFTLDELLDNIMVYWVTNSITTAMRFYAEGLNPRELGKGLEKIPVQIPTGCLIAKNEPYITQTKWILADKFPNLVHYRLIEEGGHFLSMEEPKIVAEDLFGFIQSLDKTEKPQKSKSK